MLSDFEKSVLEYPANPEFLNRHLQALQRFHGNKRQEHWAALIRDGDFAALVEELLTLHYDPSYFRATSRHYANLGQAQRIRLDSLSPEALKKIAVAI